MAQRPERACRECRAAVEHGASGDARAAAHLGACPDCAAFAARWNTAERLFRGSAAGFTPDADFARRVVAGLPPSASVVGWAAVRLLPIAAVLALLLAGAALDLGRTPAGVPGTVGFGVPADLLTYVALSDAPRGARP